VGNPWGGDLHLICSTAKAFQKQIVCTVWYYTSVRPFIFYNPSVPKNPPSLPVMVLQWSVSFTLWIWTWFNQEFAFQSSPVEGRKCVGLCLPLRHGRPELVNTTRSIYSCFHAWRNQWRTHTHQGLMKAVQHLTARITNVQRQDRKVSSVSRLYGFLRGWGRLYLSLLRACLGDQQQRERERERPNPID
jgi:hypothetical protein